MRDVQTVSILHISCLYYQSHDIILNTKIKLIVLLNELFLIIKTSFAYFFIIFYVTFRSYSTLPIKYKCHDVRK